MTQFSDDLYLGGLTGGPTLYDTSGMDLGPGGLGIGPCGRMYLWDTVPLALGAANIAASQTPTGTSVTLTAGTGITSSTNGRGESVLVIDVPRALSVHLASGGTARAYTVTGYDYTGQKMSEAITSVANSTVNGKKAFKSVLTITGAGGSVQAITIGTTDILGSPVRIPDAGYVLRAGWDNTLAEDAGTFVAAVATDPSTTTTGDVRGTYVPSSATDGSKRLVMAIGLPALASGPNATRVGGYGVSQNLA